MLLYTLNQVGKMPSITVSLSTANVPGPSAPIALNWRSGKPVAWFIGTNSSVATSDFTLQASYDDLQTANSTGYYTTTYPPTGSPTYLSSANALWGGISSNPYLTMATSAAAVHFTSSAIWPDGISGVFLAPPAALRLFSTASSSNVITLKTVQADGG
jgi:hypothetical protein